jgi:DNA modification methylase
MTVRILVGDCRQRLRELDAGSVHTCVTSPPYFGLRDYGVDGQIGLEATPDAFVAQMVAVFREVRRVLRDDGTVWLNLGDSYSAKAGQRKTTDRAGIKQQSNVASTGAPSRCVADLGAKQLIGIPWRVAFALQADGWFLRQDIIWAKPNPMPESVTDRCTKAHEYVFMLSKSARYHYDAAAIAEPAIYAGLSGQSESGYKDAQTFGVSTPGPTSNGATVAAMRASMTAGTPWSGPSNAPAPATSARSGRSRRRRSPTRTLRRSRPT